MDMDQKEYVIKKKSRLWKVLPIGAPVCKSRLVPIYRHPRQVRRSLSHNVGLIYEHPSFI